MILNGSRSSMILNEPQKSVFTEEYLVGKLKSEFKIRK